MNRITNEDLDNALKRYVRALESVGVDTSTVSLIHGSKTYGRSFKTVFVVENGGHRDTPGILSGYLGMTKREAYDTLHIMARTIEDVDYFQNQDKEG